MGNITDAIQYALTGVDPEALERGVEKYSGPLMGYGNGPHDAARHIARSAIFYSEHPRILLNDPMVDLFLDARESIATLPISSTSSPMDYHNNEIGKAIGLHIRQTGGTREDVYRMTADVLSKSFGYDLNNVSHLKMTEQGYLQSPVATVELSDGLTVASAVVMPEEQWKNRTASSTHTASAMDAFHESSELTTPLPQFRNASWQKAP
ncbi:MAG: hypothetical protein U1E36_00650 [Rickettsiales bacterium]